jgi:hypothetical protein
VNTVLSVFTGKFVKAVSVLDLEIERAIVEAARWVAPVFAINGWTWFSSPTPPDADTIADKLRQMTRSLYRDDCERVSTGRLVVERVEMDDSCSLNFYLELGEVCEDVEELS